jgi:hypothetical protein
MPQFYLSREVAEKVGCSVPAATKYAACPENGLSFAGEGRRKIYLWREEDMERFRAQIRPRPRKGKAPGG